MDKSKENDSGERDARFGAADGGDSFARGSTVARFTVLDRIGAGAMGVVYAAYDPELDRKVALKVLRPQEESADQARREARMVREAQAIARVSHPNVVSIFEVGVHEGQVFMAMEHLAGGTLRNWIAEKKRPWREIVQMFIAVGQGLAGAHAEGLIHRDFKPDNVLLDKNGTPKVVDFGLARLAAASALDLKTDEGMPAAQLPSAIGVTALTRTGAIIGTPAYMAPEQFRSQAVDARSDQFAFCVSLYEALYGERPFAGDNIIALVDSVTSGRLQAPPKNTAVPSWLRACVVHGLKTDPSQRHAGFNEVLARLANDPAKRTKKWALVGATLAAIAAAVGVTHRLGGKQRPTCTGGDAHLAGIWDPGPANSERKAAIHRAFAVSGKSYAEQAFTGAAKLLDQFAARWTRAYTETCEATQVRGEQSEEVLDLRMACLKDRLGNARALSDVFAVADGRVVENAVSAAAALPSLDRCADVALLRAVVKPPEDAATRKRVADLRVQLNELIALRDSGQCARAMPRAVSLIADARALGYQPLLAETLYESGHVGDACGDIAEVLRRFKEAHVFATASRNDEVAAQTSALIPLFAMNRLGQASVAQEWLVVARGDVARLGRETLAHAMLAQSEGIVALSERAYGRALSAADRSVAITTRLLGPDDPLTIQWEANKGDWQQMAGALEDALQTEIRAQEHLGRVLGPEHPRLALLWSNEGEVLNRLGRYDEAEAACQRAIRIYRQSGAAGDVLGYALTGLGQARLGRKRPDSAVAPLEEALAARLEKQASPALLGETRFALARALWSATAQRRRALALAVSARADSVDDPKRVADIDAWLAQARAGRMPTTR